jgi:glycosyltransferase involved in cell wall biosynthesis
MKSILINGSILSSKKTGVELYANEVITNLIKESKNDNIIYDVFVSCADIDLDLSQGHLKIIKLPLILEFIFKKNSSLYRIIWNLFVLPSLSKNYDLVYSPATYGGVNVKNQIVTIHDLICLKYPMHHVFQFIYFKTLVPLIIKRSSLITISNFTKQEVVNKYKIDPSKVTVIYNGSEHLIYSKGQQEKISFTKNKISPYFLTIGASYGHKNIFTLIEVAKRLQHTGYNFVIIGRESKYFDTVKEKVKKEKVTNVILLESVSNEILTDLYENCVANVYLSLYEGFGFPPIEAAYYNKPSIISDIPVLREIYFGFATFVDPYDISQITSKLENIIDQTENKEYLKFNYDKLIQKYSWNTTSKQIRNLFDSKLNVR